MAMLTKCFFCGKELVVPSADKYKSLSDLEDLQVFDEYKKEGWIFSLYGEYSCVECYDKKIIPNLIK